MGESQVPQSSGQTGLPELPWWVIKGSREGLIWWSQHIKKPVASGARAPANRIMEGLLWERYVFPANGSSDGQTYSFGINKNGR